MDDWMGALDWWSAKHGTEKRRSVIAIAISQEEKVRMQEEAAEEELPANPSLRDSLKEVLAEADDEDYYDDDDEDAAPEAEPEPEPVPVEEPDLQELLDSPGWSELALRHQLSALGAAAPAEGSSRRDLVFAYWECLKGLGKEHEEETRRWLAVPKEMDPDAQAGCRSLLHCHHLLHCHLHLHCHHHLHRHLHLHLHRLPHCAGEAVDLSDGQPPARRRPPPAAPPLGRAPLPARQRDQAGYRAEDRAR